jgi:hypothetical protein
MYIHILESPNRGIMGDLRVREAGRAAPPTSHEYVIAPPDRQG